jgi:hypothetical protein
MIGRTRGVIARRKTFQAAMIGLTIVVVAVIFAACGVSSGPGVASLGSTTTTAPAVGTANPSPFQSPQKEYSYMLSYAECMRIHGLPNFPDPTQNNGSISFNPKADSNSPRFSSANSSCKHLLPNNGGRPTTAQLAAETAKLLKYAQCMRIHGVPNFPDPTVKPGLFGFSLEGVDPNSSQFLAAQKTCASLGASAGF